jgi:rfaE bifunctional protein kinase chain/domain
MSKIDETIRNDFPNKRVVIVGDLVADQFLNGTISRVSREAPVFILKHENTETLPGAAANAAANVASLGGVPVLTGICGSDVNGEVLLAELKKRNVDVQNTVLDPNLKTTTKVRVVAGHHYAARQQVIRIDYENAAGISDSLQAVLMQKLEIALLTADAVIVSDYKGGVVTPAIFEKARSLAMERGIPIVVDSRFRLTEFTGATTATPNREEVENILGKDFSINDCVGLREKLNYRSLLVTNGNEGMLLVEDGRPPVTMVAVGSKQPVDVTGAGDTVIAAYTLGLASGLSFADAARIANHAGGIAVMKKRTATVTADELIRSLQSESSMVSQQAT